MTAPARVVAVVVTFNRRDLLRQCIGALQAQSRSLDGILVVDNASTDGTQAMLREDFPALEVLVMTENEGATGGFHAGIKAAADGGADWLWLLDDDTIARPDALASLLGAPARAPHLPQPSLLASWVDWRDGRPHPMNTPMVRWRDAAGLVDACEAGLLPLRATTWVSLLLHRRAVERHGLPIKQFFFQADDIEYTARVLRAEHGYFVPESVVEHRTKDAHEALSDPDSRRFYYHARNTVFMLRGEAWERREKPRLVSVLVTSSARYLQANRFSRESALTLARALRDGVSNLDAP